MASTIDLASHVSARLLGGCTIAISGRLVLPSTRKQLGLLAYLLTYPDVDHSRDALADLLWSRSTPERARHSLNQAVYGLRRVHPLLRLLTTASTVRLGGSLLEVDIHQLDAAIRSNDPQKVIRLHSGAFLDRFALARTPVFEQWQEGYRQEIDNRITECLYHAAEVHNERSEWEDVETICQHLLRSGPHSDRVYHHYFRALLAQGKTSIAESELVRYRQAAPLRVSAGGESLTEIRDMILSAMPTTRSDGPFVPFVGRRRELGHLQTALKRSMEGRCEIVIIEGEPGIGKSRLCQHFLRYAAIGGARVLQGRSYPEDPKRPFGSVSSALAERADLFDVSAIPLVLRKAVPLVFPQLALMFANTPHGTRPIGHGEAQAAAYEAVAQLLLGVLKNHPVVLYQDDFQWASESTRDLVRYLAWRLADTPLLLLISRQTTWRPSSDAWPGMPEDARLVIGKLNEHEAAALVRALATGRPHDWETNHRDRLLRLGDGHPFFLIELARSFTSTHLAGTDHATVPSRSINALIAARMDDLPVESRDLLQLAAVFGARMPEAALRKASDITPLRFVECIELLQSRSFLREDGSDYVFDHEIIRTICYDRLSLAKRAYLHLEAAKALCDSPPPSLYGAIASHYRKAGDRRMTYEFSMKAGSWAMSNAAHHEASQHFGAAAEQAPGRRARHDAQYKLAQALVCGSRFTEASAVLMSLAAELQASGESGRWVLAQTGATAMEVRMGSCSRESAAARFRYLIDRCLQPPLRRWLPHVLISCADFVIEAGDAALASQCLDAAAAVDRDELPLRNRAQLLTKLIGIRAIFFSPESASDLFEESAILIRQTSDSATRLALHVARTVPLLVRGELAAADEESARAAALAREAGSGYGYVRAALNNRAVVLLELGRLEESLACTAECEELLRATGAAGGRALLLANRGLALLEAGDFERLESVAREMISFDASTVPVWGIAAGWALLGYCALNDARSDLVRVCAENVRAIPARDLGTNDISYVEVFAARAAEHFGERGQAISRLAERIEQYRDRDVCCRCRLELEHGRLSLAAGDDGARDTIARIRAWAGGAGADSLVARADLALGEVVRRRDVGDRGRHRVVE
jgi:DNA-binding SARP family transcriptional activator/tetratricopeptide (TPR) repeat protein